MDLTYSDNLNKTLTLEQAAQRLSVTVDVLLQWSELNILKPSIMQDGQFAYSETQIEKFLEIQRLITSGKTTTNITPLATSLSPKVDNDKPFLRWMALSFSGIVLALILTKMLTFNDQIASEKDNSDTGEILASQSSRHNVASSPSLFIPIEGENTSDDNDLIDPKNKANAGINFSNTNTNQATLSANITDEEDSISDIMGYSEIANFYAGADKSSNLFDDSGNLKGEVPSADVLGMTNGLTKMIQGNPVKPTTNPSLLFTFVLLSSISFIFILKKQLAYPVSTDALAIASSLPNTSNLDQRVLEVDQKMDGTVVLYFQGKEYKLCKPELDSESDQFIDRLMELSHPDIKEIDYDRSFDDNLSLSTPLSKLVTRLGFVGIKRNLFFPRTSKNKVLFRRYITARDLMAMNLHSDQLSREFLS